MLATTSLRCSRLVTLFAILLALLGQWTPVRAMTPDQFLNTTAAPHFKPGNTLPRLTHCAWPLAYATRKALCERWGYALFFDTDDYATLSTPTSDGALTCALSATDPVNYPLSVSVLLPFQETNFLATLPEAAWTHTATGARVVPNLISPVMPDSCSQSAAGVVTAGLAQIQQICPISCILNTGEYGLTEAGNAGGVWPNDPAVMAAIGPNPSNTTWDTFISTAKARSENIIGNAVRAQVPNLNFYEYYPTDGNESRGYAGLPDDRMRSGRSITGRCAPYRRCPASICIITPSIPAGRASMTR